LSLLLDTDNTLGGFCDFKKYSLTYLTIVGCQTVQLLVDVIMFTDAVSAERARPYLLTTDAHASTDFINAVYIDVR